MEKENKKGIGTSDIKKAIKSDTFRTKVLPVIGILILVLLVIIIIDKTTNDGMKQTKGIKIYYRTYTKEKGWSSWSKNGVTSGNGEYEISKIEVKTKIRNTYNLIQYYKDGKWIDAKNDNSESKIYGIQISSMENALKKYDLCYRTYNDKNKWMDWVCDNTYSGNKESAVRKIEIKYIPKGIIKYQYLKDYTLNDKKYIGF